MLRHHIDCSIFKQEYVKNCIKQVKAIKYSDTKVTKEDLKVYSKVMMKVHKHGFCRSKQSVRVSVNFTDREGSQECNSI